ncbi:SDR family NAD(P)-dependent oxidoreductase [Reyranella sp.]|jgi:NAD(P)-dependent dehydrogenase (short-subunit alcohol dehydrogenase family)|uniref:SDR family NAD(P)-dependent oxidoreductase n=1 Tax=Reyranella sp. TaxID=1929291 RepID=UPI000BC6A72B|nr:SDR family NAD(P)-dependent oxidoreductase [Reyranella sp.]OYY44134.1 MAG: short-chain dehydrogenase [Rhodospirillales bacterium 35-66-84]OYZ94810.1 MAG: short-chain dehydrogenase [Rhodospirillales bacterium 24-66-33]OZB26115.1 MAG: short-chain dehydrogenase [Rhodospirillales bacterium 39-66-50]HQS15186.1 SDR family NAD(P)-dependent oxidoreductase [Reyranella sp.]HQT10995.1 SDR family NAD(P)-dependent oxidoreductase [Reyranella sp.]
MTDAPRKVALVTGANQGLGLALVRRLCSALGEGSTVYLASRDTGRGEAACAMLQGEGLRPELLRLDVTDDASVSAAAAAVRARHGGIDIVIQNAAARITKDAPQSEQVLQFIETNNHGTLRIVEAFVPLLRDNARFVVVASSFGSLRNLDPRFHARFDAPGLTLHEIERAMDDFVAATRAGTAREAGWPDWINIPSKIAQVASVRVLARDKSEEFRRRGILVNAACPGLVDTEASRPWFGDMSKAATSDDAAVDLVWLAALPAGTEHPYGALVRHRQPLPWV